MRGYRARPGRRSRYPHRGR